MVIPTAYHYHYHKGRLLILVLLYPFRCSPPL
jgi:hypothetical protein